MKEKERERERERDRGIRGDVHISKSRTMRGPLPKKIITRFRELCYLCCRVIYVPSQLRVIIAQRQRGLYVHDGRTRGVCVGGGGGGCGRMVVDRAMEGSSCGGRRSCLIRQVSGEIMFYCVDSY